MDQLDVFFITRGLGPNRQMSTDDIESPSIQLG